VCAYKYEKRQSVYGYARHSLPKVTKMHSWRHELYMVSLICVVFQENAKTTDEIGLQRAKAQEWHIAQLRKSDVPTVLLRPYTHVVSLQMARSAAQQRLIKLRTCTKFAWFNYTCLLLLINVVFSLSWHNPVIILS